METNGSMRPRASTLPDRLLKKPKGAKTKGANDRTSENRSGSFEKIHMEVPNGIRSPRSPTPELGSARQAYSAEGPKYKPKTMSKLAVPDSIGASPRRRGSLVGSSSSPGLLKPPIEAQRTRRKSCPLISPRPILSSTKAKSPSIRIESPRTVHDSLNNSPKSVWDEIDNALDRSVDIHRDPLPGGSPEFRRCMTQIESLDIHERRSRDERPRRLSADWKPKIKVIHADEPESPRTPRRVRWLDVS